MLIPNLLSLKSRPVFLLVDRLEDVLKPPIILLENRILGAHIQRQFLAQRELETSMSEPLNRLVSVVLCLRNPASSLEFKYFNFFDLAPLWLEDHLEGAIAFDYHILCAVLVPESMTADDNGFFPTWYQARDAGNNNRFSEDCSSQCVSDRSIGR